MKKLKMLLEWLQRNANLPKIICNHLLGNQHCHRHRMVVGVLVMLTGVFIATATHESQYQTVQYAGDTMGYLIHGMGCIPFIDFLTSIKE